MDPFEAGLRYPIRGAWLRRTTVGSLLVLGSVLVVPAVALVGYCVRVLETTLEGDPASTDGAAAAESAGASAADSASAAENAAPPAFGEWGRLLRRGAGGVAVGLAYLVGPLLVGALATAGLGVVGYAGLLWAAPAVGGNETLVFAVSAVAAALAALVVLAFVCAAFAAWYALPAALARYAATGSIRAAVQWRALVPVVASGEYFLAMAVLQLVPLVVAPVAVVCLATVVGAAFVPALSFLAVLGSCRLVGVAARRALDARPATGRAPLGDPVGAE